MSEPSTKHVEAKIRRLSKKLEVLDQLFYRGNEQDDRYLYASMLEHKLDDFVRGAVLQMHTALEDILTAIAVDALLDVRPGRRKARARALRTVKGRTAADFVNSLGFAQKVRLSKSLGTIGTKITKQLGELNRIRNACSHHWLLNVRIRRNRKPRAQKPPLITFRGLSLHQPSVFEDFVGEYGRLYVRLWAAENGLRL